MVAFVRIGVNGCHLCFPGYESWCSLVLIVVSFVKIDVDVC